MTEPAVTAIEGPYLVHKVGTKRQQHTTFGRAVDAAQHLLNSNPDDAFVITREVALVTLATPAARKSA